jgi:hypothetical protein
MLDPDAESRPAAHARVRRIHSSTTESHGSMLPPLASATRAATPAGGRASSSAASAASEGLIDPDRIRMAVSSRTMNHHSRRRDTGT